MSRMTIDREESPQEAETKASPSTMKDLQGTWLHFLSKVCEFSLLNFHNTDVADFSVSMLPTVC